MFTVSSGSLLRSGIAALAGVTCAFAAFLTLTPVSPADAQTATGSVVLSVSDGVDRATQGGTLVYVVTVRNQQPSSKMVNVTMTLPSQVNYAHAEDGGIVTDRTVRWQNVYLDGHGTATVRAMAQLLPELAQGTVIKTDVSSNGSTASDTTTILGGIVHAQAGAFDVFVTDGLETAEPGQEVQYAVRVKNKSALPTLATVVVNFPSVVGITGISDDGVNESQRIVWKNLQFAANQERTVTFKALIHKRIADRTVLRMQAAVGNTKATDDTTIRSQAAVPVVTVELDADRTVAEPEQDVKLTVRLKNSSKYAYQVPAVTVSLPPDLDFRSASDGGKWDGSSLKWLNVSVPGNGEKTLTYIVSVEDDADTDVSVSTRVTALGTTVSRSIRIVEDAPVVTRPSTRPTGSIQFRHGADQLETVPGGRVRLNVFLRNNLAAELRGAQVVVQYDGTIARVTDAGGAQSSHGRLAWTVPALQPGRTWTATYEVEIGRDLSQGASLLLSATVNGEGVDALPLPSRMAGVELHVLAELPQTGAPIDVLLALLTLPVGLTAGEIHRRLKRA